MNILPGLNLGGAALLFSAPAAAQYRLVTDIALGAGFGGLWIPILFALAVGGGVVWAIHKERR